MRSLSILFLSFGVVSARYASNLNYRSPSENHPGLGVSIHKVVKRNNPSSSWDPAQLNFTHGVASGDPYPTSIILWTRVAPAADNDQSNVTVSGYVPLWNHETEEYIQASAAPVCLDYKVSTDDSFGSAVDQGTVYTTSDIDYTVKVEAKNLEPYTTYYYQFTVCGSDNSSPVGRTKTTPRPDDDVSNIGLAIYSCSNYPFGFFNAYGNAVRKDSVDYVVHLGDYIYEYEEGGYGWGYSLGRISLPNKEIFSLYDYRKRLATYRTDLDLLASHQMFAWIPVWDDHEVGDNTYRDGSSHVNNTEESFVYDGGVSVDQRKMNAVRAYFEWMPIRQVDMDDGLRIWRSFSIGKLIDLIMLDTRQYDRSITDLYWNTHYINEISNEASRSLMGSRQEHWFYRQLSESAGRDATWRLVGNQIIFSSLNLSLLLGPEDPFNYDAWDGYAANRNRTLSHLLKHNISNTVFLAGDTHASWVSDVVWNSEHRYNPITGAGALAVEFGGTAVSSPAPVGQNITLAAANNMTEWAVGHNEHLMWNELYYRGYFELHVSKEAIEARYFGIPNTRVKSGLEISLANFTVKAGENRLSRPVAGGVVEAGTLKGGRRVETNATRDTEHE
ncbi:alkaline phosphatase-like protein [Patellaria atrata CBS 101060]|uniref:Alkaline phosphatase-like protein n=1 Tax=Patellaria atrata CBS 101060 TaxID=1346257 RepID=A0A9P4VS18_9PEZI|nr:alkaline phosphatase-like protein [Patellaria atrata CBS 101060]